MKKLKELKMDYPYVVCKRKGKNVIKIKGFKKEKDAEKYAQQLKDKGEKNISILDKVCLNKIFSVNR